MNTVPRRNERNGTIQRCGNISRHRSKATTMMRTDLGRTLQLVVLLRVVCRQGTHAELHHQRPLPRPSAEIDAAEAISLHANASRATFAVGDHLLSWLAEHPTQYVTRRRAADVTKNDVVFIVMVRQSPEERLCSSARLVVQKFVTRNRAFQLVIYCRRARSEKTVFIHKGLPGCAGPSTLSRFQTRLTRSWAS